MLWIDLTRADTEPLVFSERPVLTPQSGSEDVVSVGGVEFDGRVERADRGYLLEGRVQGAARLRCVRCLGEFDFRFAERMALHLLPSSALPQDEERRLEMGDLEMRFYDEPKIDLAEVAGEQFALSVPMKPLCAETCRGICPRCGANLNLGPCSCPEKSDDRWAPLLDWRAGK
ncbi:MAG TPA: DUF177 domain-containing protein [Thermoanaerobaculaceae bacterium]|nr:DUF177 domain-containing protein [Thermoanaerobaculaceae bacterium]